LGTGVALSTGVGSTTVGGAAGGLPACAVLDKPIAIKNPRMKIVARIRSGLFEHMLILRLLGLINSFDVQFELNEPNPRDGVRGTSFRSDKSDMTGDEKSKT
jgi:hypothetical protein